MSNTRIAASIAAGILVVIGAMTLMDNRAETPTVQEEPAPQNGIATGMDVGIALGEQAPLEQPLQNSQGEATSLAAQMGENGLVLMLVRSADWCGYCKAQLIQTSEIEEDVASRGYALASLSYDDPETLADFALNQDIGFTMLSDEGSVMIDELRLRDPEYGEDSKAFGVPRASTLVLKPDGTVAAKHVTTDFRVRPSNADILALIDSAAN